MKGYASPDFLPRTWHAPATLIIVCLPVPLKQRDIVEYYVNEHKVPLVTVNSMGLYSYFRIQYSEDFPVVDTHPDASAKTDLGIMNPWPELLEFQKSLTSNINQLDDQKHGHIPYLILLLFFVETWKLLHDGQPPETSHDKQQLKKLIQKSARGAGEENFDEAVAALMKTIKHKNELLDDLRHIFDLAMVWHKDNLTPFWIITRAVSYFHRDYKRLPFACSIPDMKAESDVYVKLQGIYKRRAQHDVELVYRYVQTLKGAELVTKEMIADYNKNIPFLIVVRKSILIRDSIEEKAACLKIVEQERQAEQWAEAAIEGEERSKKPSLFYIFLALRAVSGHTDLDESKDEFKVSNAVSDDLSGHYDTHEPQTVRGLCQSDTFLQVCEEVIRTKGHELHNTVSLTGGLVSQEVIKLLTAQYVPVDNLCVYDGIYSRMGTFKIQDIHGDRRLQ